MAKKYGSFGFLVMLLVMLVVMLLAAKAWKALAPATPAAMDQASQQLGDEDRAVSDAAGVQPQAGEALRSGRLPDLQQLKRGADQHATDVRDAVTAIDP